MLTLSRSSDYYSELISRKLCLNQELTTFKNEKDYRDMFVKLLGMKVDSTSTSNTNNVIYGKFLSFYNELKTSDHFSNPLFIQKSNNLKMNILVNFEIYGYIYYKIHQTLVNTFFLNVPLQKQHYNSIGKSFSDRCS